MRCDSTQPHQHFKSSIVAIICIWLFVKQAIMVSFSGPIKMDLCWIKSGGGWVKSGWGCYIWSAKCDYALLVEYSHEKNKLHHNNIPIPLYLLSYKTVERMKIIMSLNTWILQRKLLIQNQLNIFIQEIYFRPKQKKIMLWFNLQEFRLKE